MNALSAWTVSLGVLIIAARIPLVVNPEAGLRIIRNIIASTGKLRGLGIFSIGLGAVTVMLAGVDEPRSALVVWVLGLMMLAAGCAELFLPAFVRKIALTIWSMSVGTARFVGIISLLFGLWLVYLGWMKL